MKRFFSWLKSLFTPSNELLVKRIQALRVFPQEVELNQMLQNGRTTAGAQHVSNSFNLFETNTAPGCLMVIRSYNEATYDLKARVEQLGLDPKTRKGRIILVKQQLANLANQYAAKLAEIGLSTHKPIENKLKAAIAVEACKPHNIRVPRAKYEEHGGITPDEPKAPEDRKRSFWAVLVDMIIIIVTGGFFGIGILSALQLASLEQYTKQPAWAAIAVLAGSILFFGYARLLRIATFALLRKKPGFVWLGLVTAVVGLAFFLLEGLGFRNLLAEAMTDGIIARDAVNPSWGFVIGTLGTMFLVATETGFAVFEENRYRKELEENEVLAQKFAQIGAFVAAWEAAHPEAIVALQAMIAEYTAKKEELEALQNPKLTADAIDSGEVEDLEFQAEQVGEQFEHLRLCCFDMEYLQRRYPAA